MTYQYGHTYHRGRPMSEAEIQQAGAAHAEAEAEAEAIEIGLAAWSPFPITGASERRAAQAKLANIRRELARRSR